MYSVRIIYIIDSSSMFIRKYYFSVILNSIFLFTTIIQYSTSFGGNACPLVLIFASAEMEDSFKFFAFSDRIDPLKIYSDKKMQQLFKQI